MRHAVARTQGKIQSDLDGGDPIVRAELRAKCFHHGLRYGEIFEDGEGGGTAAGHEGKQCAIPAQEILVHGEDGEFIKGGSFEGILELRGGDREIAAAKKADQILSAARAAVQGFGKTREILV